MVQIILRYRQHSQYLLHGFVVLPDHMQLILTPTDTLERAIQCLKGGFSFAIRDQIQEEIWEQGYEEHCILDADDYEAERRNIATHALCCNYPFIHLRYAEHIDAWPVLLQ
jgi:putative transposase